jgi:hypothetical protein
MKVSRNEIHNTASEWWSRHTGRGAALAVSVGPKQDRFSLEQK